MNKQVGYCCTDIYCDYCHGTGIDQSRNDADNSTPHLITLGDELPDSYPYDFGYALSRIEDGVRVFPNIEPNESETP